MGALRLLPFRRSFSEILPSLGAAALGDENIARFHILPAQLTQRSDFLVAHGTLRYRRGLRELCRPRRRTSSGNVVSEAERKGDKHDAPGLPRPIDL